MAKIQMTNDELNQYAASSFVIRHSPFVIRHSPRLPPRKRKEPRPANLNRARLQTSQINL